MDVYSDYAGSTWLIETIKTGLVLPRVILVFIDIMKGTNDPFEFLRDEKAQFKTDVLLIKFSRNSEKLLISYIKLKCCL